MANAWLRLWHDIPNDPKWRTISRISGQPISLVLAIYIHILVSASESSERGCFSIEVEDIASSLNESDEAVNEIISAMQGRVIEGTMVLGWDRRQSPGGDFSTLQKAMGKNYIYFVSATVATGSSVATTDSTVVKVAISSNPWARLKDLKKDKSSNFELLTKLKTSVSSSDEIMVFFSKTLTKKGWITQNKAINSLIEKIKSNEITNYEQCVSFLSGLPPDSFVEIRSYVPSEIVATVATKDTDTDKDKDLKPEREISARGLPVDNSDYPDSEKFRMHPDWRPEPGFVERARGWGHDLSPASPFTESQFQQFLDYWLPETVRKHHIQWEMTLANSLAHQQKPTRPADRRNINAISPVDETIPEGFRGNNPHQDET